MERSINISEEDVQRLHKVFKAVVNKVNNEINTLGESGSEVSHLIPEPRNFS